jgi:hypothetical protein
MVDLYNGIINKATDDMSTGRDPSAVLYTAANLLDQIKIVREFQRQEMREVDITRRLQEAVNQPEVPETTEQKVQ